MFVTNRPNSAERRPEEWSTLTLTSLIVRQQQAVRCVLEDTVRHPYTAFDRVRTECPRRVVPSHQLWREDPGLTGQVSELAALKPQRRVDGPEEEDRDCADGFFEAYWRRPEAYLDEEVRLGISVWTAIGPAAEQRAVRSLREDIASGRWAERNHDLLALDAIELGLRLVIA